MGRAGIGLKSKLSGLIVNVSFTPRKENLGETLKYASGAELYASGAELHRGHIWCAAREIIQYLDGGRCGLVKCG